VATRHIVALGGGGFSMEPRNRLLDDFIVSLARRRRPRVCFIGTASGDHRGYIGRFYRAFAPPRAQPSHLSLFERTVTDLRAFVLAQDVILVGGGNTANLLAVWRTHGLDRALRAAWNAGVILAGVSAGAICWFDCGITDSFGGYRELRGGLGFVAGGCCPHYDGEARRRPVLLRAVRRGFPTTLALDNGAAAHFIGTRLAQVVSSRPRARAFRVIRSGRRAIEEPLHVRYLGAN
jgi:dipeptidase E